MFETTNQMIITFSTIVIVGNSVKLGTNLKDIWKHQRSIKNWNLDSYNYLIYSSISTGGFAMDNNYESLGNQPATHPIPDGPSPGHPTP